MDRQRSLTPREKTVLLTPVFLLWNLSRRRRKAQKIAKHQKIYKHVYRVAPNTYLLEWACGPLFIFIKQCLTFRRFDVVRYVLRPPIMADLHSNWPSSLSPTIRQPSCPSVAQYSTNSSAYGVPQLHQRYSTSRWNWCFGLAQPLTIDRLSTSRLFREATQITTLLYSVVSPWRSSDSE